MLVCTGRRGGRGLQDECTDAVPTLFTGLSTWARTLDTASAYALAASGLALLTAIAALAAATRRLSARRLASIESKAGSLQQRLGELEELLTRFDARERMRRVRQGLSTSETSPRKADAAPDPIRDPVGWKKYMREKHPPVAPATRSAE